MDRLKRTRGAVMAEALVVLTVVGGLASMAIPAYRGQLARTRASACVAERAAANRMIMLRASERPGSELNSLGQLAAEGYMQSVPNCPGGGDFVLIPPEDESGAPTVGCSIHYWPDAGKDAGEDVSGGLLGLDNFDDGDAEGWWTSSKNWQVTDGGFVGGSSDRNTGENRAFYGDPEWTDYIVDVDAELLAGSGAYGLGVYFRASDYESLDAYVFQYDPGWGSSGSFLFRKVENGREQAPFASVKAPPDYQWKGSSKHIRILVSGNTFSAYISDVEDGQTPVLTAEDDSYSNGSVGLRTWLTSQAEFDNVQISQLP